jgi:hypothetical protein
MNKKNKIILLSALLLAVVVIIFLTQKQPCSPPEKPETLAENALWFGDCDGGNWIELVSANYNKKTFRFRIYRDYDGVLEMDTNFELLNCDEINIDENNWSEMIVGYLNESISVKAEQDCTLRPIYPAYSGEEWEIIKEKRNLD